MRRAPSKFHLNSSNDIHKYPQQQTPAALWNLLLAISCKALLAHTSCWRRWTRNQCKYTCWFPSSVYRLQARLKRSARRWVGPEALSLAWGGGGWGFICSREWRHSGIIGPAMQLGVYLLTRCIPLSRCFGRSKSIEQYCLNGVRIQTPGVVSCSQSVWLEESWKKTLLGSG